MEKNYEAWAAEHRAMVKRQEQDRLFEGEAETLRWRVRSVLRSYIEDWDDQTKRMQWGNEIDRLSKVVKEFGHVCTHTLAAKAMIAYQRCHCMSGWEWVDADDSFTLESAFVDLTWCAMATLEPSLKKEMDAFYSESAARTERLIRERRENQSGRRKQRAVGAIAG